jgi:hypothetical protein
MRARRSTLVSLGSCAATMVLLPLAFASRTLAQPGFCLRDANGDGHPLFGNPEVMLNPIMAVQARST